MIVCKFGGTSVGDASAIERLIEIIRVRLAERPIVVLSALSGVTDRLIALAALAAAGDHDAIGEALEALRRRHAAVAEALPGTAGVVESIAADLAALRLVLGGIARDHVAPRHLDALAAHGELWSSRLVAAAMAASGVPAEWVDVRPVILTDERFTRATPLVEHLPERASKAFQAPVDQGRVPVTQGFIGSTAGGLPTTLGRGGSDFTASLLGAALGAERVEIWTDVDGLMTADPRIVASATTLPVATYDEAAELATFGAKVLHPATQQPLARRGIPIIILNSRRPDHPGTTIVTSAELHRPGDSPVRSISWKKGITVINIRTPRLLGAFGVLREIFEVFERHEVVVDVLASGEVSVSVTIEDASRLPEVAGDLGRLGEVAVTGHRAIVAVVGVGIRDTAGIAARVFKAVQPVNVEMISQGASAINMTFIVREEDGPETVRRLHQEFFGSV